MKPTKKDIKKWLKDIGKDRVWLGKQCGGASKRTVDDWLSTGREVPAKAILIIQGLMNRGQDPQDEGRNFQRVDTITLQFSKSEWEDILAYQKMNPGKNLAELAEEFILKLTDDIENEAKYKDDDYALPVIGNIVADRFMAGDTIPWKVKPRKKYPSDYFGLRVYGNSMEPLVSNDQIAVIRPWDDPNMPDIGDIVVYSNGRGVMLKQLALRDGKYVLSSLNPLYKDITPIDGEGRITGIYVDKLDDFRKA